MTAARIPYAEQVESARREIKQRERVYPRLVAGGKMTQAFADLELARMRAILATLILVDDINRNVVEAGPDATISADLLLETADEGKRAALEVSIRHSLDALLIRPADTGRLL